MNSPTWYDLLSVDPTASTDEIRAAWRSAVEGLDPTDRRFQTLSRAAAVLLDEDSRRAYDDSLAPASAPADEPAQRVEEMPPDHSIGRSTEESAQQREATGGVGRRVRGALASLRRERREDRANGESRPAASAGAAGPRVVPGWVLATLGVVAAALVAASGVSLSRSPGSHGQDVVTVANDNTSVSTVGDSAGQELTYDHTTDVESDGAAALAAAKTAVVPVLSYDYRHMDQSRQQAEAYLTDTYRAQYDKLFALLQQNAPSTHTVVKTNPPIDAGVVRVSPGRVEVLLFVDRPTTNKRHKQPINYQNYVTLTMQQVGDRWLIDDIQTTAAGS